MSAKLLCPTCGERLFETGSGASVKCPKCGAKSPALLPVATATLLEKVETRKGSRIGVLAGAIKAVVWLNCVVTCMESRRNGSPAGSFFRAMRRNDYVSGQSTFRVEDAFTFAFEIVSLFAVSFAICALVDAVVEILNCFRAK